MITTMLMSESQIPRNRATTKEEEVPSSLESTSSEAPSRWSRAAAALPTRMANTPSPSTLIRQV